MGPHFFTHPISSDVKWNHLKTGVNGVDSRFKFVGTKRKADSSIHTGNPSSLENALYVIDEDDDDVKAHTNVKETELLHQDFSLSPLYPQCYSSSVLDNLTAPWQLLNLSKKPVGYKKIKRTVSMPETNVGNSLLDGGSFPIRRNFSTNSLPKLQFRDHIWTYTQRYLAAEAIDNAMLENGMVENEGNVDGMHLVQLLISCAEAVACRDKAHATNLLAELRANALVFGSSFQRVASCFMQGLTDRLALVQPLGAVGLVAPTMNVNNVIASEKKEEALRLVYEVCPQIKFGHFVANLTILEAFEGESFVHVVDLGLTLGLAHGHQWRDLIDSLANDVSQVVRRIRITAVGPCANRFHTIGDELEAYARELSVNLEFSVVESSLETLQPEDIKTYENEVLVVNSILQLHCVVKESRGALNSVLQIIHELCPKVLVLVEQDSSHNGPFFLGRFMEALYYYSAIFDALDAMLPKYDTRRAKIEQFYFAEEIKNIVSCEGPNRVERHERVDQWRRRMSRAGFQAAPVKLVARAKQWLSKLEICDGYTIVEEKGSLVLGWKLKPIVAASCWKC